jgi:hypothetical protein
MKRASAILGSAIFLVIAPGTLAVYIPWTSCRWRFAPPLFRLPGFRVAGALMILAGLPVLLDSFARFAIQGHSRADRCSATTSDYGTLSLRS